jgi:hypothetical protein
MSIFMSDFFNFPALFGKEAGTGNAGAGINRNAPF